MEFEKQFEVGRKLHKKYASKLSEYDAQIQLISTLKAKKEPDQAKITQAINLLSSIEDSRNDAFVESGLLTTFHSFLASKLFLLIRI